MAEVEIATLPAPGGPTADPLWANWDIPPRTPTIPTVHVAGFDGPMDVLLDLAERQRLDLGRISILQLAEQFVAAMAALETVVPLNRRGDWLVMATRLVQLRSQTLLTDSPDAVAQAIDAIAAEEEQVEERLRMRAAADWLDRQPQLGRDVFARPAPPGPSGPAREADLLALLEGVLLVMDGPRQPAVLPERYRPALFRGWPVAEARARILALLDRQPDQGAPLSLLDCLPPAPAPATEEAAIQRRAELSSVFCAALELEKGGSVSIMPARPVPSILIEQRDPT